MLRPKVGLFSMKKALKLILVDVASAPKVIADKKSGMALNKWRHTFMTPEGKELIAWSDNDMYKALITPVLEWDDAKSKPYLFESTMWEGVERLRLVERTVADAFMRAMEASTKKK